MSIETMTKLSTQTVGVGGTASITFSNIPQSYTDLVILTSARASNGARYDDGLSISFNSSSSNFTGKDLWGNSSSASSGSYTSGFIAFMPGSSTTANTFSNNQIYIPNYAGSTYKSISVESNQENNSSTINQSFVQMEASLWSNTSAITSITLQSWYGNTLAQHSTFTLYGIKNARTAAGNSIKATGGAISFDGTYVVHTFGSSGTFTPTVPNLLVDYLVVAGGGSGGGGLNGSSGGGGAGGLRSTVTATGGGGSLESALSLSTQAYTVTVGAGGAAQSGDARGNSGTDSSFWTITSTGGGGGGALTTSQGNSGGSGGGSYNNASVGAGTTNQGYAGGSGSNNVGGTGRYPSGGGGGAGAVGVNGTGTVAGNGGSGVTTSISGSSITYAGGGGGGYGRETTGSTGTGGTGGSGGGGNGTADTTAGGKGTANTGGGGGGCGQGATGGSGGGAGGSGIIVIRYKA